MKVTAKDRAEALARGELLPVGTTPGVQAVFRWEHENAQHDTTPRPGCAACEKGGAR
jgi:hypothetical protein